MINLRSFLLFSLSILFFGCSMIDTNRIAPGYVAAYEAIRLNIFGYENNIDPNVIKNIPYASMLVRIGKGPSALMILESVNEDTFTWVSADGVYLVTKNGKIIKTAGLPNNLNQRLDPKLKWKDLSSKNEEYVSYVSFKDPDLNNLKVVSDYFVGEYENHELFMTNKTLKLIEENINSNIIGWYETNSYWIDDENFIWKSTQYVTPKIPPIHYEVTKRPL